ncbi:colicin R system lysis protein, partial [Salmonella enterica subsp. enterica serovar Typhimurium]|nr:colicin release lysis protein [Escherichia coli]EGF6469774.1 colicin release lysis protein [Escherichia coli]EJC4399000.1 colicin release lysis protein [Escherichia coli]NYO06575.1 colicin R system lysis protein [Salmonella enterica subsp. enterica serovar Typhimurium]
TVAPSSSSELTGIAVQ